MTDYMVRTRHRDQPGIRNLEVVPTPNQHLKYMCRSLPLLTQAFFSRPITVVTLDAPLFITSDDAVIGLTDTDHVTHLPSCAKNTRRRRKDARKPSRNRSRNADILHVYPTHPPPAATPEAVLTLSPYALLAVGPRGEVADGPMHLTGTEAEEIAAFVNARLVDQALDWVAAHPDHPTFTSMDFPEVGPLVNVCDGGPRSPHSSPARRHLESLPCSAALADRASTVPAGGPTLGATGSRNGFAANCRGVGMTETLPTPSQVMTNADRDEEPTPEEIEAWEREHVYASAEHSTDEMFPRLWNVSAGFLKRAIIRPLAPEPPEYVTIHLPAARISVDDSIRRRVAVAEWNQLWEVAQFRRRFFDDEELPADLARIADRGDFNIILVPRTASRFYEYAPLYHLLDRATCERFGLPLLGLGQWPFTMETVDIAKYLPVDFERRLSRAWASTVWRHIEPRSGLVAFTRDDPIRLLAHNLDYWLPPVTAVIQNTLRDFPLVGNPDGELPSEVRLVDGSVLHEAVPGWPRMGGDIWRGQDEAAEVVALAVDQADEVSQLRGILEAVRSHRVVEDFSARWSYVRADFERKLYRKRDKIKVKFVELTDTIPVQGPETEVEDRLVFADFMALLDPKEREVVVLLSRGVTKLTDIAAEMGYANHSPVSKKLAAVRRAARAYFDGLA
jgi:hypothetical protein